LLLADKDMKYQILLQQQHLIDTCANWQLATLEVPTAYPMDHNWGPSAQDINESLIQSSTGPWDVENDEDEDEDVRFLLLLMHIEDLIIPSLQILFKLMNIMLRG
jgi:hypothetical protein